MLNEPIKLVLIDDDPIFRLGLSTALQPFRDLQTSAQTDTINALDEMVKFANSLPDLLVLACDEFDSPSDTISGLQLCQTIKDNYPNLPILLLAPTLEPSQIAAARACDINGYCPKGIAIDELVVAIRQVVAGKVYWRESRQQIAAPSKGKLLLKPATPQWLQKQQQLGLEQIAEQLVAVDNKLQNSQIGIWNKFYWYGRRRELSLARWLVDKMGKSPQDRTKISSLPGQENPALGAGKPKQSDKKSNPYLSVNRSSSLPMRQSLWDDLLAKINSNLINLTDIPLEIDILQVERKRELLYLVMQQFQKGLEELRLLQVKPEELQARKLPILRDLWQSASIDFLSRYYTPPPQESKSQLVEIFLAEAVVVQKDNLDKIPLVVDLYAYLLFKQPLVVDNIPYRVDSPEAVAQAGILLENLVIQVANGVVQLLLNRFWELETLKYSLYNRDYLSSRAIAQFRNELSWRTRLQDWFREPQAIFESKYYLYVLQSNGIKRIGVYAPRQAELKRLEDMPWIVTIVLEFRDAIAPRIRNLIAFLGGGVVYFLTQVIGRGIGLIGRGIIQGIGNTMQNK